MNYTDIMIKIRRLSQT